MAPGLTISTDVAGPTAENNGFHSVEDKVTVKLAQDGSTQSIKFANDPQDFSPTYLINEGIFLHAKLDPNALCVRLPTLKDHDVYVDVTYATAASIVESLTYGIKDQLQSMGIAAGPGITVAVLTLPYPHSFFHVHALWQLGCTVQWFNHELGMEAMDSMLAKAQILLHAGLTDQEEKDLGLDNIFERIQVYTLKLEEEHYAVSLAERQDWPSSREPKTRKYYKHTIQTSLAYPYNLLLPLQKQNLP